jgi:hypothetical protein
MITQTLKETISNRGKFTTFSLAIEMLKKVIDILIQYGISCETMSFIKEGMERISKELTEASQWADANEKFNNIIKTLESGDSNGQNTSRNQ